MHEDEENQHGMKTKLVEAEAFAPADRIQPANDELNPNGAVMQDHSTSTRSRKLEKKGLFLKKSTLYNNRKINSRLLRQASVTEDLMYTYKNMVTVEEEIAQYDYILKWLLLAHEEYHSLLKKPDKCNNGEWFEEVDKRVFRFKHKLHNWLKDAEVKQGHSSKKSSKIRSK